MKQMNDVLSYFGHTASGLSSHAKLLFSRGKTDEFLALCHALLPAAALFPADVARRFEKSVVILDADLAPPVVDEDIESEVKP